MEGCNSANRYYNKNREKIRAYGKEYYARHKEELLAAKRKKPLKGGVPNEMPQM